MSGASNREESSQALSSTNTDLQDISQSERGAISVIFGVLLSGFLVVGLLALVIDVGVLYQERRTLQNAADATALAIAQECAELNSGSAAPILCQSTNLIPASQFSGKNSDDGKTNVSQVCGIGSAALTPCPPSSSKQFDCKDSSLSGVEQFVRVRTTSLSSDGQSSVRYFFAPFLKNAINSVSMRACAQVAWGAATEAPVVYPLALPICFYQDLFENQHNAYDENDPIYLPAEDCPYTPIGSPSPIQLDIPVVKGMAMFTAINGANSGCPSIFNPVIVKLGDILTPIAPGNGNDIASICSATVQSLGYNQTQNLAYQNYLRDFVLGKTLYVPVIKELDCPDPRGCKRLKVGYFFSVIVKGIKVKNVFEVGFGKSGPSNIASNSGWENVDCSSNSYCFYGKFTRATPPGRPTKVDPNQPNTGVNKVLLLP